MEIAQNLQVDRLVDECAKFITENIKPRSGFLYLLPMLLPSSLSLALLPYFSRFCLFLTISIYFLCYFLEFIWDCRVATDYLELAAKLGRQLLYKHCLEYIQVNFDKVSVTKSFLAISEKSFDAVIRSHLVLPLSLAYA